MAKFNTLTIADLRRETADTVSIKFDIPQDFKDDYFSFLPGQNITVRTVIDKEEIRRSYSICSIPEEGELRVAIKQIPNGKFSSFANNLLKIGDKIEVAPPTGNFHLSGTTDEKKSYFFIAVGSGITPVISMIKSVLLNRHNSSVTLLYGNRTFDSIIFRDELENLKNKYMNRFMLTNMLSREFLDNELLQGRINVEKCEEFATSLFDFLKQDAYFLCGPQEMIISISEWLVQKGMEKKNIHFELFKTGQKKEGKTNKNKNVSREGLCEVRAILDGVTTVFDLPKSGANVLEAATEAGLDAPFSCKGGVCCTCKAKIIEGKVEMDLNFALEDDEVREGYILTCQSHPVTDNLVITYDV